MKKKAKKQFVSVFDFTDTKCPIPMHLDRYRVRLVSTKELAMAIPVNQDGMLVFKVKTPLGNQWTEHFKEELELAYSYSNEEACRKWESLK